MPVVNSFLNELVEALNEKYPRCTFWCTHDPGISRLNEKPSPTIVDALIVVMSPKDDKFTIILPPAIDLEEYLYE